MREVFFGEREETACQPGGREFVPENLRDLHVCIVWAGLSGTYWTQLEFLSPDGHVYQTTTLAFVTPEARATVAAVEVDGRQYEVRPAGWAQRGEAVVVARLRVAGTYITQHNLAGQWTAKISLNGRLVDQDYVMQWATRSRIRGSCRERERCWPTVGPSITRACACDSAWSSIPTPSTRAFRAPARPGGRARRGADSRGARRDPPPAAHRSPCSSARSR